MLTRKNVQFIRSLHTKKGRRESGMTLVEGQKNIETAGKAVEWTFDNTDVPGFDSLVSTDTPQGLAGIARIPDWSMDDITSSPVIVVLDGVQDPGNVGTILRLCLGFGATVLAVESADISAPKVVRASSGALFQVPWRVVKRTEALETLTSLQRPIYRIEKRPGAMTLGHAATLEQPCVVIAGSEGNGIHIRAEGTSLVIPHAEALESLNVAGALGIVLWELSQRS